MKPLQNQQLTQVRIRLRWLLIILAALIIFELWGGYQLAVRNLWGRMIQVPSLQSLRVKPVPAREYYRQKVDNQAWNIKQDQLTRALKAMQWTRNQARKIGYNPHNDPVALLRSVESGAGALCAEMADIYQNTLAALNIPSRKIHLYRDLYSHDTHATVEVYFNRKWILLDPTFGVYFVDDRGEILSCMDLKRVLFSGKVQEVKPVFFNHSSYPARMEKYYMSYWLLYNNGFVVDKPDIFHQIPPLCFWWGTKFYYQRLPNESVFQIEFTQQLFIIFALWVPVLILFITGCIMITLIQAAKSGNENQNGAF